jgi:hypothetical protein
MAEIGRMPVRELLEWQTFEEEFGPMLIQERIDAAIALLTHQQAVYHGATDVTVADFYPRWEDEEPKAHIVDWLSAVARKP